MKNVFVRRYHPTTIYLLTTEIISDYHDGSEAGPIFVTQYYLAKKRGNTFYEFFSKVKLKKENRAVLGYVFKEFNVPIIKEIDTMETYVKDPNTKVTAEELFAFITKLNAEEVAFRISKLKNQK